MHTSSRITSVLLLVVLFALASCSSATPTPSASLPAAAVTNAPTATSPAPTGKTLVLGTTSATPVKKIAAFQPMADYLAAQLAAYGYTAGVVKVAPDPETMASWLKTGVVDLDFESLYPALVVSAGSGAQPFLRRWKGGNPEYHTMFIVRADSGIRSMAELPGHVVGFEDPFSTSGYFMPKSLLVRLKLKSVEASGPEVVMPTDTVGYVFTKEATSTIQWMLSGKLQAGAVDNWAFAALSAETKAKLVVLDQTEDVTRHVAMARPRLHPVHARGASSAGLTDWLPMCGTCVPPSPPGAARWWRVC
jgi:phosphonate transport system substrate-binding protein